MFEPQHAWDLSDDNKKKALLSLIFLRQKKNGAVKARSCANGNPQREHITKEEAAAPTVKLESVFLTTTIDVKENREVVMIDIPGAFLHADNEDYVIMKMVGMLADVQAIYCSGERKVCIISAIAEGPVWNDEERAFILQKTGTGIEKDGV